MKNSGKKLEALIKLSSEEQGIDYTRLKDSGWQGEQTQRRFTPKNICDCILFRSPVIFFIEAKSRKSSLRFDEITQLSDIEKKHKPKDNIFSGVLACLGGEYFWISVTGIRNAQRMIGKKSFNKKDAEIYGIKIETIIPKGKRAPRLDLCFI